MRSVIIPRIFLLVAILQGCSLFKKPYAERLPGSWDCMDARLGEMSTGVPLNLTGDFEQGFTLLADSTYHPRFCDEDSCYTDSSMLRYWQIDSTHQLVLMDGSGKSQRWHIDKQFVNTLKVHSPEGFQLIFKRVNGVNEEDDQ